MRALALFAFVLVLSACAKVGPNYVPPENKTLPTAWIQAKGPQESASMVLWWQDLGDAQLNALIEKAKADNLDLKIAAARVMAARAAVGVAGAEYMPQINASGETMRAKSSRQVSRNIPSPQQSVDTFDTIGMGAGWEIDLFGRVSRSVEAAKADAQAVEADARAVHVILYADIAAAYVELRTLQERLLLAQKNAQAQAETRNLVRHKFEAGLVSELDVSQAERNLAITRSAIPSFEAGIDAALYRLATLTGQMPGALDADLRIKGPIPSLPEEVIGAMPRDVVRQRPDIQAAERRLAASVARIGMTKADLYPRLSLMGNFTQSAASGPLMVSSASGWSFGPSLTWALFTGGRVQSQVKVKEAETDAARAAYEGTVLQALAEVEIALSTYTHEADRGAELKKSVRAAKQSENLVRAAYDAGLADFQNVLDAQRALFEQQDTEAASRGTRVADYIRIVRSMGGGWPSEEENKKP